MTETREINGKIYEVTDGKIISPNGIVINGYAGIHDAPRPILDAAREKGLDLTDRVYYGGYFVPTELAELAEIQKIEVRKQTKTDMESAVPGYHELSAAIDAEIGYRRAFDRMMEDEYNDGVNPPAKPKTDVDALREQYPVAAAYIRAESWNSASHDVKAAAGHKAMAAIRDGQDYQTVIATMETEWSEWCTEHVD